MSHRNHSSIYIHLIDTNTYILYIHYMCYRSTPKPSPHMSFACHFSWEKRQEHPSISFSVAPLFPHNIKLKEKASGLFVGNGKPKPHCGSGNSGMCLSLSHFFCVGVVFYRFISWFATFTYLDTQNIVIRQMTELNWMANGKWCNIFRRAMNSLKRLYIIYPIIVFD